MVVTQLTLSLPILSGANAQQYNDQISGQLNEASTWGGVDQGAAGCLQYVADQAAQAGQDLCRRRQPAVGIDDSRSYQVELLLSLMSSGGEITADDMSSRSRNLLMNIVRHHQRRWYQP